MATPATRDALARDEQLWADQRPDREKRSSTDDAGDLPDGWGVRGWDNHRCPLHGSVGTERSGPAGTAPAGEIREDHHVTAHAIPRLRCYTFLPAVRLE